jgi:hypothetical protein
VRSFILERDTDVSGVSGTGVIAEGIQFSTGKCALGWVTQYQSVAVYDNIETLMHIHGHDGKTRLVWISLEDGET